MKTIRALRTWLFVFGLSLSALTGIFFWFSHIPGFDIGYELFALRSLAFAYLLEHFITLYRREE